MTANNSLDITHVRADIKMIFEKYNIRLEDFDIDIHEPSTTITFTIRGHAGL